MSNIHLHSAIAKYIGAKATVTRVDEGVKISMSDYQGSTEEIIAEAIESIITNDDGSLTFVLPNGSEITTESLTGPRGIGITSIEKTGTSGLVDTYTITYDDDDTETFTVTNGATGPAAGFGTVSATVDANHGTPAVTVTASGDDTAKNFAFAFSNLQPAPYDDSTIQARMDTFTNLAEGSTTGDAELIDGRVGADGVTYANIGGAIRGQVSDVKSDLKSIRTDLYNGDVTLNLGFRNGWINGSGVYNPSDSRWLSRVFSTADGDVIINDSSETVYIIYFSAFSSLSDYTYASNSLLVAGASLPVDKTKAYFAVESNQTSPALLPDISVVGSSILEYLSYRNISNIRDTIDLNAIDLNYSEDWEQGRYGGVKNEVVYKVDASNRIRLKKIELTPYVSVTVTPTSGYKCYAWVCNANDVAISVSDWFTSSLTFETSPLTKYLYVMLANASDSDLDTSKSNKCSIIAKTLISEIIDDVKADLSRVYNGEYIDALKLSSGVELSSYSVGDVVDISGLSIAGTHYTALIDGIVGGEKFNLNIVDGSVRRPWAFLDADYKLLSMSPSAFAQDVIITAPASAEYLLVQCGNGWYTDASKVTRLYSLSALYSLVSEDGDGFDINQLNNHTAMVEMLENASNVSTNDTSTSVKNRENLLNLVHFSDVHGSTTNISRILDYSDKYSDYIHDIIHTGDSVSTYYGNDNPFAAVGGDRILNVIGNHECWIQGDTWPHPYNATAQQAYEKIFAPYISDWDVISAGENLCYYYKDYSSANVRLIVLDALHYDATQETWFEGVLADAITEDLRVVAVTHYPAQTGINGFDCTFNSRTQSLDAVADPAVGAQIERMPESAFSVVDDFISDGGEFVCWLSGHTHDDFIGTVNNHTNQIQIIISCALTSNKYSDCARTNGTKTQDLFNVFTVDGNAKLIKLIRVGSTMDKFMRRRETLCINYTTKEIVSNN